MKSDFLDLFNEYLMRKLWKKREVGSWDDEYDEEFDFNDDEKENDDNEEETETEEIEDLYYDNIFDEVSINIIWVNNMTS